MAKINDNKNKLQQASPANKPVEQADPASAPVEQTPVQQNDASESPVPETEKEPEPTPEPASKTEDAPDPGKIELSDFEEFVAANHPTPEREITEKMCQYIEDKLKHNGLAQVAIEKKDARTLMLMAAQACVGIREVGGNNRGPLVEMIQDTIGDNKEPLAWCMSFVQTMIAYAELRTGVKSLIYPSEGCLDVWNKTPANLRATMTPLPGAIIIWRHGNTANGHTGIVLSVSDDGVLNAIEGNTEAGIAKDGKVERDGGGVYATKRNKNGSGDMRVMGFLKPF